MADLKLLVSTEDVREKASQINMQKSLMEGIMGDLQSKVNELGEYVRSEAGEAYVQQYMNVSKNIQSSLDALMRHTNNLTEMASKYEARGSEIKNEASALSAENIFN